MLPDAGADSGVPSAALLLRYAEAILDDDEPTRASAADEIRRTLGAAALADAAGIVASFNAVVKLADGSGIPLEDYKAEATADLRGALDLDRLAHGA